MPFAECAKATPTYFRARTAALGAHEPGAKQASIGREDDSMKGRISLTILCSVIASQLAYGEVCDYTPSQLIGGGATAVVEGTAVAAAATGVGMKAAGLYAITHSTSAAAMLGSTAAGASAAGTTGIIAGSAGFLGTAGAVLMSPFVIIPAAVVAVGVGAYEGACYFAAEDSELAESESEIPEDTSSQEASE